MQKANLAEDLDAATSKCEALAAKLKNATNELSAAQVGHCWCILLVDALVDVLGDALVDCVC